MMAYQLKAKFEADLQLVGQYEDNVLEWLGSKDSWREAHRLEEAFELGEQWAIDKLTPISF